MRNILTIMRRELSSYFLSPIIYIVMALFVVIYGFFFVLMFLGGGNGGYANMQYSFGNLVIVFLIIIPLLTMRSLAEERKIGTEEFLMTAPITSTEIVLGKMSALTVSFLVIISTILVHLVIILTMAQPEMGPIISSFIGLFLLGITFLSIGLFASSLTDNQIVAGAVSFTILLLLWLINWLASSSVGILSKILSSISLINYYADFTKGILDTANIIFYLSVSALFVFLTIRQVEARRWR
jgi:ABC-2 type transport system permease protein